MNIINYYYSTLLNFTSFTGFNLTNEDSRAVFIFTFVFLFNLGTILSTFNIDLLSFDKLILILTFAVCFYLFYKYFSKSERKKDILNMYNELNFKNKISLNVISLIFTILSVILFFKTS